LYLKCFKIVDGEYSTPLRELTPSLAKEEKDEVGGGGGRGGGGGGKGGGGGGKGGRGGGNRGGVLGWV